MGEEKDTRVFDCTKPVSDLLGEGKFKDAFELLDRYIVHAQLVDQLSDLAIIKVQFYNAEKAINLSVISWDQYKIDNSRIVKCAINLTHELCNYIKALGLDDIPTMTTPPTVHHTDTKSFEEPTGKYFHSTEDPDIQYINTTITYQYSEYIKAISAILGVFLGYYMSLIIYPDNVLIGIVGAGLGLGLGLGLGHIIIINYILDVVGAKYKIFLQESLLQEVRKSFKALINEINSLEPKEPDANQKTDLTGK